jgi:Protein of unknown function (DUF4238)
MGHHYVPQRYLQNFSDPAQPKIIWLHDKRGGNAKLVAIKQVANERQFYAQETEDRLARQVELPGNQAIDKLLSGQEISSSERLDLAHYIGIMHKRVPYHRKKAATMIPGALEQVTAGINEMLRVAEAESLSDPETITRRRKEFDAVLEKYKREPPASVFEQINDPKVSHLIEMTIYEMTWRILVSSGPQFFITTDNPAFFFEGLGLGNAESELTFPLSTTHALHGSWQGPKCGQLRLEVDQRIVKEINRRLASSTDRFAFYHREASWLLKILPKQNQYLSRIRW